MLGVGYLRLCTSESGATSDVRHSTDTKTPKIPELGHLRATKSNKRREFGLQRIVGNTLLALLIGQITRRKRRQPYALHSITRTGLVRSSHRIRRGTFRFRGSWIIPRHPRCSPKPPPPT